MTTYVKASDSIVKVVDSKGKEHNVTQRAFDVVYRNQGYKLAEAKEPVDVDTGNDSSEPVDYFASSREDLRKVKNDDLKAFLDKEDLEYDSKVNKEGLIDVILGE